MLSKDHYLEKTADLAQNIGELYRVRNHKICLDQVIREFYFRQESDLLDALVRVQIQQSISHYNLVKIHGFIHTDHYEAYQLEEARDKAVIDLSNRAKQIQSKQQQQIQLLKDLSNTLLLTAPPDVDCFEDLRVPTVKPTNIFEQLLNEAAGEDVLHSNHSAETFLTLIQKSSAPKLNYLREQSTIASKLQSRQAQRVKFTLSIAQEDFSSTLASEVLLRKQENFPFSFSQIIDFLSQSVNLLAGLQFHGQEIRDVYPHNIFIGLDQLRVGSSKRILYGVGQEYIKFFSPLSKQLKGKSSGDAFHYQDFSRLYRGSGVGFLSPELKETYLKDSFTLKKEEVSLYKSAVFSLGLVTLMMATLEDVAGLNLPDDTVIKKKIKKLLKRAGREYCQDLSRVLELMLQFNQKDRPDFVQLDECEVFIKLMKRSPEYLEVSLVFDEKDKAKRLHAEKEKYAENCERMEVYECSQETVEEELTRGGIRFTSLNSLQCVNSVGFDRALLAMSEMNSLEKLMNLSVVQVRLGEQVLSIISSACPRLTSLVLKKCEVDRELLRVLMKEGKNGASFENLKELDLSSNNQIKDSGFIEIITSHHLPQLRRLSMGGPMKGCGLTLKSLRSVYNLSQSGSERREGGGEVFWRLKYLDLSWNDLNEISLNYVLQHYQLFKHLLTLDISKCQFDTHKLLDALSFKDQAKLKRNIRLE